MENPIPTVGRIVLYRLNRSDVQTIRERRDTQHIGGNSVNEGDTIPMVIVAVWSNGPRSAVNGQVLLDGPDGHYWATSVAVGEGPGTFSWPTRT